MKKKKEIVSWVINVEWSDGTKENIGDLPDDVAQGIDDCLNELENN